MCASHQILVIFLFIICSLIAEAAAARNDLDDRDYNDSNDSNDGNRQEWRWYEQWSLSEDQILISALRWFYVLRIWSQGISNVWKI